MGLGIEGRQIRTKVGRCVGVVAFVDSVTQRSGGRRSPGLEHLSAEVEGCVLIEGFPNCFCNGKGRFTLAHRGPVLQGEVGGSEAGNGVVAINGNWQDPGV
jgi:hypothetical protein